MKICVIQREGTRYFTRFTSLSERDKLEVELVLQDKNNQTLHIDLTSALIEAYQQHPEIGKVSTPTVEEIIDIQPVKAPTKGSRKAAKANLNESKVEKDSILARVREAQYKAAEERQARQAEINAAKAERLVAARKAKADKEAAEAAKKKPAAKAKTTSAKPIAKVATKPAASKTTAKPTKAKETPARPGKNGSSKATKAEAVGLSKDQQAAIKKIGKVLAKEDKVKTPKAKAAAKA